MNEHMIKHGDAVKDVAFLVEDLDGIVEVRMCHRAFIDSRRTDGYCTWMQKAKDMGGKIVKDIWSESDEHGTVRFASIQTVSMAKTSILAAL